MARKLASVSKLSLSLHHISHPQPYNEENEKMLWQHVKTSKPAPAPNKQRPTPPPRPHSICEIICIHPDAGEVVVFPRRLAHRLSRFWITCIIPRAGEMQTPERCRGHLVPATHRKQSRAVRAIIQHPGTAGTKHPAGPDQSAWASQAISKVLQPLPVLQENLVYHPSTQNQTSEHLTAPAPKLGLESAAPPPLTVWLVPSFGGVWGAFSVGFSLLGFFKSKSTEQLTQWKI